MPATEFQRSSAAGFNQFGHSSVFSLKRHHHHHNNLVNPVMDGAQALDLDTFQTHVADCFQHLSSPSQDLFSLSWLRDLLDGFLCIHHQFKLLLLLLSTLKSNVSKPAVDHLLSNLDICNAICDGIEQMRQLMMEKLSREWVGDR